MAVTVTLGSLYLTEIVRWAQLSILVTERSLRFWRIHSGFVNPGSTQIDCFRTPDRLVGPNSRWVEGWLKRAQSLSLIKKAKAKVKAKLKAKLPFKQKENSARNLMPRKTPVSPQLHAGHEYINLTLESISSLQDAELGFCQHLFDTKKKNQLSTSTASVSLYKAHVTATASEWIAWTVWKFDPLASFLLWQNLGFVHAKVLPDSSSSPLRAIPFDVLGGILPF